METSNEHEPAVGSLPPSLSVERETLAPTPPLSKRFVLLAQVADVLTELIEVREGGEVLIRGDLFRADAPEMYQMLRSWLESQPGYGK